MQCSLMVCLGLVHLVQTRVTMALRPDARCITSSPTANKAVLPTCSPLGVVGVDSDSVVVSGVNFRFGLYPQVADFERSALKIAYRPEGSPP